MDISESLKKEIEKYLIRKNVYFDNFSDDLKLYLAEKYPYLSTVRARWYMVVNNLTTIPSCSYQKCKNPVKWNESKKKFDSGCCLDHNKKITYLKNFGVDHPNKSKKQQKKVKKSMREKYGVDYITQTQTHKMRVKESTSAKYGVDNVLKVPEIREKIKHTNLERYGFEDPICSPEIREKIKNTNLERFGFESCLSSPEIREKISKTNLERFGSIFPMRNEELLAKRKSTIEEKYDVNGIISVKEISEKVRKKHFKRFYEGKLSNNKFVMPLFTLDEYKGVKCYKPYEWRCKICECEFVDNVDNGHMPRCPNCFPKDIRVSNAETELFESINVENKLQTNRNIITGFEIDIYLPEFKVGIEYNGMYWHSEQKGIDKFYHLDKTILAENEGIFLIHIFEVEWLFRRKQVLALIEKCIGLCSRTIHTDDLIITNISDTIMNSFIDENSIHFSISYNEKKVGAFYNEELVAVMALKHFKDKDIVTKFCEKNDIYFNGDIFGKMLNVFNVLNTVFYYPDRRFHRVNDEKILKSGFSFEGGTEPELLYNKKMNFIHSQNIHRKNIQNFVLHYDNSLSIYENMILNGYFSIWNCGKLVYKK